MKAIILAAGKGERLKEITNEIPKPMILYKGKPILEHNLELCKKYGIKEFYFNLHHLPEKIKDYFGDGSKFDVSIKYSFESELLGTSGAVRKIANEYFPKNDSQFSISLGSSSESLKVPQSHGPTFSQSFFVIYGDNFSNFNLESLIQKLNGNDAIGVIAFHYREDVSHSGVAEFDNSGRVLKFIEKPKQGETESHWVNAGIYLFKDEILKYIPDGFSDFGKDIFPKLLKLNIPIYGVCSDTTVKAFDTIEMYNKNKE